MFRKIQIQVQQILDNYEKDEILHQKKLKIFYEQTIKQLEAGEKPQLPQEQQNANILTEQLIRNFNKSQRYQQNPTTSAQMEKIKKNIQVEKNKQTQNLKQEISAETEKITKNFVETQNFAQQQQKLMEELNKTNFSKSGIKTTMSTIK